ncbi:MAG TPA: DNA polymerase Y family protein [Burkholderiales bacterium]|nr:DNA polymerase Y family protein [Burkholderiales bacterium]
MLWLALHFFKLPLDTLARGVCPGTPLAVASSCASGASLVACNAMAHARGVRSGMSVASAWALAADLNIVVRDERAERAALERIAGWALKFTPVISLSPPGDILLEVEGSLNLFGGLGALHWHVAQGLAELGYSAHLACAPTPLAAQLFSHAGLATRIRHRDALRVELQKLAVDLLADRSEVKEMLASFGVRTIGECLELPRAGAALRLGQKLIDDIDRALGLLPDPRPPFATPKMFKATLPLPAPVTQSEALLFGARRLVNELCGWLAATGQGALRLSWTLRHEDREDTPLDMALVAASRDAEHLLNVLRERLGRIELKSPVSAIVLHAAQLEALASRNFSFLPESRPGGESAARLIERLRARLGEDAVCGLGTCADHRPERAWRACTPGEGMADKVPRALAARPLWLLAVPQPLGEIAGSPHYDGPLSLLCGPERIESGWWDGADVSRDYFVARNPAQSLLWIYREYSVPTAWYLHGFFG